MNGLAKLIFAAIGIGVVYKLATTDRNNKKYLVKYLIGVSPNERNVFFDDKEMALSVFNEHKKTDSYISLYERVGNSEKFNEIKYDKGLGKKHK